MKKDDKFKLELKSYIKTLPKSFSRMRKISKKMNAILVCRLTTLDTTDKKSLQISYSLLKTFLNVIKTILTIFKSHNKKSIDKNININALEEEETHYKIYNALDYHFKSDREKALEPDFYIEDDWLRECIEKDYDSIIEYRNYKEIMNPSFYFYEFANVLECSNGAIMRQISTENISGDIECREFAHPDECSKCDRKNRCFDESNKGKTFVVVKDFDGEWFLINGNLIKVEEPNKVPREYDVYKASESAEEVEIKTEYLKDDDDNKPTGRNNIKSDWWAYYAASILDKNKPDIKDSS